MPGRGPHVCPSCGERVSAFAAGCALCGAALDPLRAERRPSLADRLRIRRSDRRRGGSDQEGRQTAA